MKKESLLKILGLISLFAIIVLSVLTGKGGFSTNEIVTGQTLPPKDIVIILTDDQRWDTMQYMPLTQNLIGNQGVQFQNAFTSTPLCCPSRSSIFTGLYAHNTGVYNNNPPYGALAFQDSSTIATWLQAAGYRTSLVGKYLNSYDKKTPWPYQPPGWSDWHVFKNYGYYNYRLVENGKEVAYGSKANQYSTNVLTQRAVSFINSTPIDQPLFLYYAPFAPHTPATPANKDKTLFSTLPPWRPPSFNEANVSDKPLWIQNKTPFTTTQIATLDTTRKNQIRTLQAVDRGVQSIVNALSQTGRLNNTVIIFMSDNGFSWGEHRLQQKNHLYEEEMRIPLYIRAPGVSPRGDTHFVQNIDIAPTIAEFAGIAPGLTPNGESLVPLLQDPNAPWRQEMLLEVLAKDDQRSTEPPLFAVHDSQYVYAELNTGEYELYDLIADPYQLQNLANDSAYTSIISDLKIKLDNLKSQ